MDMHLLPSLLTLLLAWPKHGTETKKRIGMNICKHLRVSYGLDGKVAMMRLLVPSIQCIMLLLLDYTVYLTFNSGSFRDQPASAHSWKIDICGPDAEY